MARQLVGIAEEHDLGQDGTPANPRDTARLRGREVR
jgi:hypothetical protein